LVVAHHFCEFLFQLFQAGSPVFSSCRKENEMMQEGVLVLMLTVVLRRLCDAFSDAILRLDQYPDVFSPLVDKFVVNSLCEISVTFVRQTWEYIELRTVCRIDQAFIPGRGITDLKL
jgi:hypothetical protein